MSVLMRLQVLLAREDVLGSIFTIDLLTSWSKAFFFKTLNISFNYWVYSDKHAKHYSMLFLEYFERIYKKIQNADILYPRFSVLYRIWELNLTFVLQYITVVVFGVLVSSIYHEFIFNHCRPEHAWSNCHWTLSNQ